MEVLAWGDCVVQLAQHAALGLVGPVDGDEGAPLAGAFLRDRFTDRDISPLTIWSLRPRPLKTKVSASISSASQATWSICTWRSQPMKPTRPNWRRLVSRRQCTFSTVAPNLSWTTATCGQV